MAEPTLKYTFSLFYSIAVVVIGNSFLYGYQIGVVNTPAPIIKDFYREVYNERMGAKPKNVTTENNMTYVDEYDMIQAWKIDLLWSSTVAAFVLFGAIGAFTARYIADTFGRKRGLIIITPLVFLSALFGGIPIIAKSPECLILSRALIGLHSGINITLVPLYLTEIAPKKIRGAVGTCHQLAITIGILFSQILGMPSLLGNGLWPMLFIFNAVVSMAFLILFPPCPESPRWLLITKDMTEDARIALEKLRGYNNTNDEVDEMRLEAVQSNMAKHFGLRNLMQRRLRLPTLIACIGQITQQWSGINAVMSYSAFIFIQANVAPASIPYVIVGTGLINVAATVVAIPLMEKLGRRPLLLWPMCVMAGSFVLLTIFLELQFNEALVDSHSLFAIICIVLMHIYIVGFAVGLGPIPFTIVGEIFRQDARASAMSLSIACNWVCNFMLMWGFPFLSIMLGAYTYLLFAAILIGAIVFFFFFLPETKNRTFSDIAGSINRRRRRKQDTRL